MWAEHSIKKVSSTPNCSETSIKAPYSQSPKPDVLPTLYFAASVAVMAVI
jgi:hypothetical protein